MSNTNVRGPRANTIVSTAVTASSTALQRSRRRITAVTSPMTASAMAAVPTYPTVSKPPALTSAPVVRRLPNRTRKR